MNTETQNQPKAKETKPKNNNSKTEKLVGNKRKSSKRTGASSDQSLEDSNNSKLHANENDYDISDLSDDDSSSTNNQLFKIEKKIKQADLTKRERRLLQNRKSALKCRLKKQEELDDMKKLVDQMQQENRELKEKVSAMNALLLCKTEENASINKKFSELQFQQTLILISTLSQGNPNGLTRALSSLQTLQQSHSAALAQAQMTSQQQQ